MNTQKVQLYATLGVSIECSTEDVTRAYRRLALKYHPDRNPDGVEEFKRISNAYAVLCDPERRAAYDLTGIVSEFPDASHDASDVVARQQRSAELADQVRGFFATYAGSPEERRDVMEGYKKCNGDFKKMVQQYLLFDNGLDTEVERLRCLVLMLIAKGKLSKTTTWEATSTPQSVRRLEKSLRREREEAEKVLKEMAGNGTGVPATTDRGLDGLQMMIRQRQKSSYASMLDDLEKRYVTKKTSNPRQTKKRSREPALTDPNETNVATKRPKSSHKA